MVFAALAAPTIWAAAAAAGSIHTQVKGKEAIAEFGVFDTLTCDDGSTRPMQTFFSIRSGEVLIKMQGQQTTTLRTDIFVSSFNPCTFEFVGSSGTFFGGDLPMNALESGTLAGHFVLNDGKVLDLNLTLTGSDQIASGRRMERRNFGNVMFMSRQIGTSRSAVISGTATFDGRVIPASQMADTNASLARNTSGEFIVVQAGK
jgi:hypothetical protein